MEKGQGVGTERGAGDTYCNLLLSHRESETRAAWCVEQTQNHGPGLLTSTPLLQV